MVLERMVEPKRILNHDSGNTGYLPSFLSCLVGNKYVIFFLTCSSGILPVLVKCLERDDK